MYNKTLKVRRKIMAKKKYYAVQVGKIPGIYGTWDECKAQTEGGSKV